MTNSGRQEAINQGMQGDAASELGAFTSAVTHCAEAADLIRKLGDDTGLVRALIFQGAAAQKLGGFASAATHHAESAGLFRKLGEDTGLALAHVV